MSSFDAWRMALVSKFWYSLWSNEYIWRNLFLFESNMVIPSDITWNYKNLKIMIKMSQIRYWVIRFLYKVPLALSLYTFSVSNEELREIFRIPSYENPISYIREELMKTFEIRLVDIGKYIERETYGMHDICVSVCSPLFDGKEILYSKDPSDKQLLMFILRIYIAHCNSLDNKILDEISEKLHPFSVGLGPCIDGIIHNQAMMHEFSHVFQCFNYRDSCWKSPDLSKCSLREILLEHIVQDKRCYKKSVWNFFSSHGLEVPVCPKCGK